MIRRFLLVALTVSIGLQLFLSWRLHTERARVGAIMEEAQAVIYQAQQARIRQTRREVTPDKPCYQGMTLAPGESCAMTLSIPVDRTELNP